MRRIIEIGLLLSLTDCFSNMAPQGSLSQAAAINAAPTPPNGTAPTSDVPPSPLPPANPNAVAAPTPDPNANPGSNPNGLNPNTVPPPPPGHLAIRNGRLVDPNGTRITLHGINWYGFDTADTMVGGAQQAGGNPLGGDFATVVQRMMLLGFNTVRLPFGFDTLSLPPLPLSTGCAIPSQADVATSVTPPGQTPPAQVPPLPAPPPRNPGQCNDYVGGTSVQDRLVWVANFFAHNGFYVVLDNHLRTDSTAAADPAGWVQKWSALAAQLNQDPVTANHLMIDLLNEPDNLALRWEAHDGLLGLKDLYLNAMDAITANAPNQIFLLEGAAQGGIFANWGDGFCTDPAVVASKALSDPNPFFTALRAKPYAHQVVISPHVYGHVVTSVNIDAQGPALFDRLSTSFGYLTQQGYCIGTACETFALVLGEFGSRFTDADDAATITDLATYLNNTGAAADGRHIKLGDWIYWDWNPDSQDTGGLVDDGWNGIVWSKIEFLQGLGLTHL